MHSSVNILNLTIILFFFGLMYVRGNEIYMHSSANILKILLLFYFIPFWSYTAMYVVVEVFKVFCSCIMEILRSIENLIITGCNILAGKAH